MKNIDSLSLEAVSIKYCEVMHIFLQVKCLKNLKKKNRKRHSIVLFLPGFSKFMIFCPDLYILYFLCLSEHLEVIT